MTLSFPTLRSSDLLALIQSGRFFLNKSLNRVLIEEGLPEETEEEHEQRSAGNKAQNTFCTLRGTVWKLMLGALHVDAQRYLDLIKLGPCWADGKLRNDTFRTLQVLTPTLIVISIAPRSEEHTSAFPPLMRTS